MLTLIIETSTEKGLISLSENGKPIASCPLPGGSELSRTLAQEVKKLLNGKIPQAIAAGTGPGSYTGIRVGASLAKALSFGWNIPLIGYCSLEAFGPKPVLFDARMGGFYALLKETPEKIEPNDPRLESFKIIRSPHPDLIKKRIISSAIIEETDPSPERLGQICFETYKKGKIPSFELNYLSIP